MCQVKEENPGLDMLMAVKWADHMLGNLIVEERELPPLEGIGEIIDSQPPVSPVQNQQPVETQEKEDDDSIPTGLIVVLSVLALLAFGSFYLRRKSK